MKFTHILTTSILITTLVSCVPHVAAMKKRPIDAVSTDQQGQRSGQITPVPALVSSNQAEQPSKRRKKDEAPSTSSSSASSAAKSLQPRPMTIALMPQPQPMPEPYITPAPALANAAAMKQSFGFTKKTTDQRQRIQEINDILVKNRHIFDQNRIQIDNETATIIAANIQEKEEALLKGTKLGLQEIVDFAVRYLQKAQQSTSISLISTSSVALSSTIHTTKKLSYLQRLMQCFKKRKRDDSSVASSTTNLFNFPDEILTMIASFVVRNGTKRDCKNLRSMELACRQLRDIVHSNDSNMSDITISIRITNADVERFPSYKTGLERFLTSHRNISHVHVDVSNTNIFKEELQQLLAVPKIKEVIQSLNCNGCNNLIELVCSGCTGLTTLQLPAGLRDLVCSGCTGLTTLQLPAGLRNLDCSGCTGLTTLQLPAGLSGLTCSGCTGLTTLQLPAGLWRLTCSGCTGLTTLQLPAGLICLVCSGCTGLTTLQLPAGLRDLVCSGCTGLTTLQLPAGLWYLVCSGCTGLTTLQLPAGLSGLTCSGCTGLTTLQLPAGLICLVCSGCTGLTTLQLPANLGDLACSGCTSLQSATLPHSPHGLTIGLVLRTFCPGIKITYV